MDITEDLSARVLLKHILNVEPPRTPITRSASAKSNGIRRSNRLNQTAAGGQTPQSILRRSLKNKIQESISRKSLPSTGRTTLTVLKRANTPASASVLFDDGETPRHLLKKILLTEPVKSPVVNEQAELVDQQPQLPSANSSLQSKCPSLDLSKLELTDVTVGNIASTVKGLSRKRPRRSLNVTAFEKRLKEGNVEEDEESLGDHTSLSIPSSASLSLKTPFVDVRTEKKGLQRKVSNRRKISEKEFGAAVNKRQMGNYDGVSALATEKGLSETTYSEGLTLGFSKLSEPDITTDIVHCSTLFAKSEGIMANFSTLATQDKPMVMASQLQRDLNEQLEVNNLQYPFPVEENCLIDPQVSSSSQVDLQESVNEDPTTTSQSQQKDEDDPREKEENIEQIQLENADSQSEDEAAMRSEEEADDIQSETKAQQSHQEASTESARLEEDADNSQPSDEDEVNEDEREGNDEEVEGDEEMVVEGGGATIESEEDEMAADKDENRELDNSEHISRRAQRSEGPPLMPMHNIDKDLPNNTKTEYLETESEGHDARDTHSDMDIQNDEISQADFETSGMVESPNHEDASSMDADPDANKDNDENDPPKDVEQEEQSEEEEEEENDIQSKTPAFVKQKIFFNSHPEASSSTNQNIQHRATSTDVPAAKPKQKANRKPRMIKSDPGLPKSYLINVFKHFAKTKVSADVYPVLKEIMDKFFDRLAKDLEAYALHARRTTIEAADCELLLRRQGHVNDKVPIEVLIEKYLRMDQRKLLIPIATSGNVVFPRKR